MKMSNAITALPCYSDEKSLYPMVDIARSVVTKQSYRQPLLLISQDQLRLSARRFKAAMPRVQPHFAVKSNPDPRVLSILKEEALSFEIASVAELDSLLALGVAGKDILYSNPIKSEAYIKYAAEKMVQWYAVDSVAEVQKIHRIYPGASLYLRINTSNQGSVWPLAGKFGTTMEEAEAVMDECLRLKMDLAGITFHVGSQCLNVTNWRLGIRSALIYFRLMKHKGLVPRLLNLGGGFPACMTQDTPTIEEIGAAINLELQSVEDAIKVVAEPGRNLVAPAGCMVTQVVGTATRSGQPWLYLDTGVYGGLIELTDNFRYPVVTDRKGREVGWTIAGPTCDSIDVCLKNQLLPANMMAGDLVYIPFTGAYTTCCASTFNGFPVPEVVMV